MARDRVKQFYSALGGEELVDPTKFIPEIVDYLQKEREMILRIIRRENYAGIMEVGCMDGRNMDIAAEAGVSYVGIDIVKRFIDNARINLRQINLNGVVAECDVKNLSPVRDFLSLRHLAFFPFNSFGNIDDPERALESVRENNLDSLILTYKTDERSSNVRRDYLVNNSMKNLRKRVTKKGIVFQSPRGLSSYAYNFETMSRMASNAGYSNCTSIPLSEIGVAYFLKSQ
ncbi:class I SAM-dependent methyltransferase [Candidatus Pacearchaeota archaeon]|nr:class I SAM-dependent methyltransferase [Candidatus Pacearchaeota archaeon]